ncbi:MAG TPA: glycosyltransferase family 2 protein [Gammaproteobacteria bacterium]|nr:glycosyltransferase family 2 protein [Gammaproteobacteria bacterium]
MRIPPGGPDGVTVIVTTYNWPAALACCLRSLWRQTRLPDEIVIADDGSGPPTCDLIRHLESRSPVPLRHIWHPDEGYRPGAIRNRAVAAAVQPYLLFTDHDMLLHPRMIEDHLRFAESGHFSQGKRAHLGKRASRRILASGKLARSPLPWEIRERHQYAVRMPFLSRLYPLSRPVLAGVISANLGAWRDDVVRVNGFNEDFRGWGGHDTDLVARLLNAGVRRRDLRFTAVAYHLHHKRRSPSDSSPNARYLEQTVRDRRTWCENGLSKYLTGVDIPRRIPPESDRTRATRAQS